MGLILFLFIVIASEYCLYRIINTPDEDKKASIPNVFEDYNIRIHEYIHREDEKKFWSCSTRWNIATFCIAIAALLVAKATFDDAHKALTAVQRAFVYVDNPNPPIALRLINGDQMYIFTPQWKSIGQTQPINLRVGIACPLIRADLIRKPLSIKASDLFFGQRIVGPGQTFFGVSCFFPQAYVNFIKSGSYFSPAFMRAEYEDVFGGRHVTERCDLIEGLDEDRLGGKTPSGKPNLVASGSPCDEHNCTDEQCSR